MATKTASTVRVRTEAYDALEKLVAQIARFGWAVIGRNSDENATKEAVVTHAIMELARRAKK
jgi:hypothetical protein